MLISYDFNKNCLTAFGSVSPIELPPFSLRPHPKLIARVDNLLEHVTINRRLLRSLALVRTQLTQTRLVHILNRLPVHLGQTARPWRVGLL